MMAAHSLSDQGDNRTPGKLPHYMRIRRRLPILLGVLLVAAALALVVLLRKQAPPESARLLPGADAFVFVDLAWARRAGVVNQLPPVSHDPEYENFIQQTGFQFERDLDQAAFAVHYSPSGKSAAAAPEQPRFSEVFAGRIQGERLISYLRKTSRSVDSYHSVDIFNIPIEGRILRVAILGVGTVAASNHDDPEVIRGIVDRSRKLASPFGGPAFLRQYYKHVPIASLAWAIVRVDASYDRLARRFDTWSRLLPKPAVVVASARYIRALHLKAEAYASSADDAKAISDQVGTFLNLFHAAGDATAPEGADADVKAFFDSLKMERQGDRAVLTATVPPGFIHKILTESPLPQTPPPSPPPSEEQKAKPAPGKAAMPKPK